MELDPTQAIDSLEIVAANAAPTPAKEKAYVCQTANALFTLNPVEGTVPPEGDPCHKLWCEAVVHQWHGHFAHFSRFDAHTFAACVERYTKPGTQYLFHGHYACGTSLKKRIQFKVGTIVTEWEGYKTTWKLSVSERKFPSKHGDQQRIEYVLKFNRDDSTSVYTTSNVVLQLTMIERARNAKSFEEFIRTFPEGDLKKHFANLRAVYKLVNGNEELPEWTNLEATLPPAVREATAFPFTSGYAAFIKEEVERLVSSLSFLFDCLARGLTPVKPVAPSHCLPDGARTCCPYYRPSKHRKNCPSRLASALAWGADDSPHGGDGLVQAFAGLIAQRSVLSSAGRPTRRNGDCALVLHPGEHVRPSPEGLERREPERVLCSGEEPGDDDCEERSHDDHPGEPRAGLARPSRLVDLGAARGLPVGSAPGDCNAEAPLRDNGAGGGPAVHPRTEQALSWESARSAHELPTRSATESEVAGLYPPLLKRGVCAGSGSSEPKRVRSS